MTAAFIFPGQGSQAVGMGKALGETFASARRVFEEVDEALGDRLSATMWEGPADRVTLTANAQPALVAVSLAAMRVLTHMGAAMITVIEYSRRFNVMDMDQRLLYAFLPRLPESPGAFSEAQLRWINGHYPEDFALVCRLNLEAAMGEGQI